MNLSSKIAVALAVAGILSVNVGAEAAERTMKPLRGISFDVGAKRAVSYFQSEQGLCKLTLVVGGQIQGDEIATDIPARFEVAIDAGKGARLDAAEGKALEFACQAGATAMTVNEVEQVATYAQK